MSEQPIPEIAVPTATSKFNDPAGDGFVRWFAALKASITVALVEVRNQAVTNANAAVASGISALRAPLSDDGAGDLVLAGGNGAPTWLQAGAFLDSVTGVALPTPKAVEAMARAGLLASSGTGDLVLVAENGTRTWFQASQYTRGNGVTGPTQEALDTLALSGVPVLYQGPPPANLNLAQGEIRLYINDGEPVLAVGS